ncbi:MULTISPECIES: BadF/BadG/BcrA/BcrD ATPase family protein [unclassified Streptomyces]|uniref:N-acetylglucosamine kinase n=1 Tax=unclassified Streptomyces TaxID=2593676 RepID=UPI00331777D1
MSNDVSQEWVIGLDAGGTRTRAVLAAAEDGRHLGEGAAGPGNALTVPVPLLTDHLAEAIGQAVPEALRARVVAVSGGFAGATAASTEEPGHVNARAALTAALGRLGIPADRLRVCSDIEAAFASAPGTPADGLALVAGTGAVALRITGRTTTTSVDGDGWLLGDDGSGFWIGRSAVRAALRMADGRGPTTVLADSVGQALGVPAEELPGDGAWSRAHREAYRMRVLPAVMAELPIRLARFAPLVVEAAGKRDTVAEGILDDAAAQLLDTVRALEPKPGERIVATGGLLGPEGPLTASLTARLHTLGLTLDWVPDGCRGAVALARLAHDGHPR